jgi:glutathione S-transferase
LCVNLSTVRQRSEVALKLYNDQLKNRRWIALDHPTVADVAAFPALSQCGDGDISLNGYDAIEAWLERVRGLSGFVGLLD